MNATRQLIEQQVERVRRRLWVRTFVHVWMVTTAIALTLAALVYLLPPFIFNSAAAWLTWGAPAGLIAAGTVVAGLVTRKTAPSFVASALALDHAFDLRERVTTYCTLSPGVADSGVGQLLVEDVRQRVAGLDVKSQFPLQFRWKEAAWPVFAGGLALAASFFDPSWIGASTSVPPQRTNLVDAREVQQQIDNLRKVSTNKEKEGMKSEKLKELEDAWNKLIEKPLNPNDQEQVRERANEMRALEEKMKNRLRDLKVQAEKNKEIKKALDQLAKDLGKGVDKGPMKDLNNALAKNDLDQVGKILDQLARDLADNKLGHDEQKDLANKMKEFQEKLHKLTNQKEQKEKLHKDRKEARKELQEIKDRLKKLADQKDQEGLKRLLDEQQKKQQELDQMDNELDNLDDLAQDLQDLQDFADALEECQKCLNQGNKEGAGKNLKNALEKIKGMKMTDAELKELMENQQALEAARLAMLQACQGEGDRPGGNGQKASKNPGGLRPKGKDPEGGKIIEDRLKGNPDPKGKQRITGFSRGGTFQKIPSSEVGGAFKQVSQDAPEALDRQQIPPEAADLAKGYFNKLGGQHSK